MDRIVHGFDDLIHNWDEQSVDLSLLPMDDGRNSGAATNRQISDAMTYGPRFCQLFNSFNVKCNPAIDTGRHLMSLCTQYLIPFCQWARENDAQMKSIRQILLGNDYLRTEVIIYTFASIKAIHGAPELDMFITLQDTENGLGIANKFSLKIYNDPYLYLTFLKSCISGLIDAGAIPDNERLNQPKQKRTKVNRQENQEELDAYEQIQKELTEYLDGGDNAKARELVLNITTLWESKAKFIRNRKFTSVMHCLRSNSLPSSNTNNNNGGNICGGDTEGEEIVRGRMCGDLDDMSTNSFQPVMQQGSFDADFDYSNRNNENDDNIDCALDRSEAQTQLDGQSNRKRYPADISSINVSIDDSINKRQSLAIEREWPASAACTNTASSASSFNAASSSVSSYAIGVGIDATGVVSTSSVSNTKTGGVTGQVEAVKNLGTNPLPQQRSCIRVLRFERTGLNEWDVKDSLIFDIGLFFRSSACNAVHGFCGIHLLDETALSRACKCLEQNKFQGAADSRGLACLVQELNKIQHNILVMSWRPEDLEQLNYFIQSCQQCSSHSPRVPGAVNTCKLLQHWRQSISRNDDSSRRLTIDSSGDVGCLMYESVHRIGVVLRTCPEIGLTEDLWSFLYPQDIRVLTQDNQSRFGDFLTSLFPQLGIALTKLKIKMRSSRSKLDSTAHCLDDIDLADLVVIKYYAHYSIQNNGSSGGHFKSGNSDATDSTVGNSSTAFSSSSTANMQDLEHSSIPPAAKLSSYRTVGLLSTISSGVLSRIDVGPRFHDFSITYTSLHDLDA